MKRSSIMDSFSNITKPVLKTFFCLFASLIFIYSIIFSAPTASADIATGLISHYKLDETSGSTASDSAGANTGTVSGATFTTGKISNGLNLNGTTDYVSVPRMNYNEISVSAWFYKSVNDTVNADAIWGGWYWSSNPSNRQGFDLRFYQSAPDTLSFLLETIGATTTEKTSSYALSPSTGAWHHAVATYESVSGNQKLYVDGILRSTVLHPAGATIKPLAQYADMRIGYSRINSGYFNGKIDDVRIYNRALSATDVTELYNANKPAVTTNAAANITSTSATLNGTVNPNGLASTAYFEYGLTSGTYSITTATQNLTGSNTQNLTANISSLTASTIYYYRAVATNSLGTTNGQEQSFTTTVAPDTTLPSISITYPTTNSTYSATSSTVSLSGTASDNVGVTSVTWTNSANSTSGTASGTTSWSIASIPLVSGNNLITVIAKDATNNQSTDTITVDYSTISAGLISYWKLDEISGTTASDSTGSNTGTVTGATWTTAKINNGLSFNGTSNYLNVANNSTLTPTGDMSLSAWVKFDRLSTEIGSGQKIVYKGHNVTPWESYEIAMDTTNQIVFTRAGGTSSYAGAGYSGAVSKGVWYHIVGVSSGSSMKIYINGADSTSWQYNNVSGSFLQSSNMDLRIGNSPWNSGYFKGGVDEVRLYNRALTSAEVTELYGLVAQYKFDEGSGTAVSDSTGNGNNGNIVGSAWTTGIGGSALNFNGSGNYVFKSNPSIAIKPSNQVSVSAWVKATTTDSYGSDIVSMGDSYGIRIIPDGNISFVYHNDTTWNILTSTGVNALDNQWHLITGQKTPSSSEIYFDGVLKKSVLGTGVINYDWSAGIYYWIPDWPTYEGGSGSDLRIGKSGHDHTAPDNGGDWGRFYFNGKIDEVRIYNRALSTTEINELYNTSLGLVGHWKLDEISGMIASDSVGTNNGAVANATWTAGKNGNALSFSGENAYVTIGDVFDASSGDMSVAAWVKYDQIKNQEMIMKRHSVSPWASWEFGMNINNEPIFSVVNTAHTYVTAGYQGNVTTDTWYHMIGVKNGNNILFYLNGSDCNTWTETFSGTVQNGDSPLGFGNSTSGGGWSFQGSLDDVRIYNRALSLEEVTGLYTATGGGTVPSCPSKTLPPPQNFGVGISFATPNDPASLLYWTAPTGGIYPLVNYEAENLGEWGPTSLPSTTLNYTDEDVLNGTYYIFEVRAVYRDTVGNIYKSEPASVLIRIPTAEECDCGIWKHCPYVTDAPTYKYAVNFMSQLQMPPGTATTSVVSYSIPSGDYRVKLVSAFKNSVDMIDTNINSKWYVKLTNGGAQVAVTSPSSNFSNIDSYPYYAFKNEIVNESLSIPAATSAQGEWTGSVSAYSPSSTYNYTNAVCAYFEKINPATGLPYTSGSSGAVSIDSFAANQSPINSGSTTVLSWTSSNADYCTASGGWSGFKNLSGSTTTLPIYGTTTFGLKCVSGDGSSEISKVVTVNINSSANTIASVNCQPSPKIANIGQQVTWTVSPIPFSNLYTYSWSGDGLTGSAQTVTKTYSTTGTKTGIVDIGGASNPQQCTGTVRITASPSFDEF